MFLGFVRDRGAMIFTILIPVLFLVLLGSIYKSSSTPHLTVVEVGKVSLLDQAAGHGQLNQILKITRSRDLAAAVSDVRQGNDDAVVQQQGNALVVRYSIADQVTAGVVSAVSPRLCSRPTSRPPAVPPPSGWPPGRSRTRR
jgi:ABC-2 type transport system permease protein